ncbi:immunoglobulin superfamily containing leucine-rich repeat protein-like [Saccostrea cucullata]|uniref:immunoglobulin superfamily containing leucine-rich repeat protein-like n=1 Tax=Saccostrea cuccullata TaxID=36930 RepID=UPI002ED0A363
MSRKVFNKQIRVLVLIISMAVWVSGNNKRNNGSFCPETPCVCWNPETADCSHRNLSSISFHLPSSIKILILTGNKFLSVLDDMFINVSTRNITRLSMDHCHIKSISHELLKILIIIIQSSVFDNLKSIHKIVLNNNYLSAIDYMSFPSFVWKNKAIFLDLSSNPFDCGCQVIWFVNWLKNNKVKKEQKNFLIYTNVFHLVTSVVYFLPIFMLQNATVQSSI